MLVFILTVFTFLARFRRFALFMFLTMPVAKFPLAIIAVVVITDVETKAVIVVAAVLIGFILS